MTETCTTEYLESKRYQRHIKRHVLAPVHRFAAVTPPELAALCRQEAEMAGFDVTGLSDAGVEFTGNLGACYESNLWLRTASRILCRLPAFRAGVREELFGKVSGIPWELWLNRSIPVRVETHVEHSRINHEGMVFETVLDGLRRRFREKGIVPPPEWEPSRGRPGRESDENSMKQRILVRLVRNHCELSLDTTGDHLHRRGYRMRHAGAPIRETLAAAILMKAGWNGNTPLVDGMCGAGTVAVEAALLARRMPPGLGRSFLFQSWPSYREKTWEFLLRKARERVSAHPAAPIVALDRDPRALAVARENARKAHTEKEIIWREEDFFDFQPARMGLSEGLLILDPPYGKRLPGPDRGFYDRLGAHLRRLYTGWRIAVLCPERGIAVTGIRAVRYWRIVHGGTPIYVAMARVE
ncbi:MAG TPA: hypothetical protein PK250_03740 [Syntrophobacter fumaroxidans]|nr:hypothetical protein [Syntrophobacter fumaroxidans]